MRIILDDEEATLNLGATIATLCPQTLCVIHLEGELGAGKTTFTRGFLVALGHLGKVKSPTYTLVEHYQLAQRNIFHFDLYRLSDAGELEFLGIDDYLQGNTTCLIEWAVRGSEYLPSPDITIKIDYLKQGREATIEAHSSNGEEICDKLHKKFN